MAKEKTIYYTRKFLNPSKVNSGAYIIASIIKTFHKGRLNKKTGKRYKDTVERDIEFTIADCSRIVNLEFDFWNKKQARQYLKKLDTLVEILTDFRKAYKKEVDAYIKEKK